MGGPPPGGMGGPPPGGMGGPPPGGMGGPPPGGGYPGAPGGPPGGQAAAAGFGAPVGQPSGGALGAFGAQMGGAMAQAGAGNPLAGGGAGAKPQIRNPVMTLLMMFIPLYGLIVWYGMVKELKDYTQDPNFFVFGWLIPCYNIIWILLKLPEQVTKAKQMAGAQRPAKSFFLYWLVPGWALASDLNEVADPNWTG